MLLVKRYSNLVKVSIWNYFFRQEMVDDVCQEVFLKAYSSLGSLQKPERFKNWLLQITFRMCVDMDRKNRRERQYLQEAGGSGESMLMVAAADETAPGEEVSVLQLLSRLPPLDCLIIWMRFIEEMSYADVAEIVGSTEVAIRQKASRAMKTMRNQVK